MPQFLLGRKLADILGRRLTLLLGLVVFTLGNVLAAKSCLDSIAKIFLPDEKTLNLNANVQGDITIDFNLIEDEG